MLCKAASSVMAIALGASLPLAAWAAAASPKPMTMKGMSMPHQCRDAKGHFIKGKYAKCPAGTHKAM
jgi:hypothetical protein